MRLDAATLHGQAPRVVGDALCEFRGGLGGEGDDPIRSITPFFVEKTGDRLRLVWDCRGSSKIFQQALAPSMPSGVTWSNIELGTDEVLYTAQSDLQDFFYSLGISPQLSA